ncbi:MAG TPA: hypothetical protein VMH48_10890 [Methylomirabilota bacterium]|nr:hypothetical protein [Methylomirabilota bacterium]
MSYVQRRRFLWVLLFALMALLAVAANATTLARMRFEELAHQATAVARVRCLGVRSFWDSGEIWTETRFQVIEQNKGSLPEFISVHTIGGNVGNLHSRVDEVPVFRVGEEAYVFLWNREGEPFRVLGWSQGAFRIRRDPRTGLETVTQDSAAAPIFDPVTRQFRHGGIRNLAVAVFQLKLKKALEINAP